MKTETALNHRSRAILNLKDSYSIARHAKSTSAEMNVRFNEIMATISHCPTWVREYVRGARSILDDNLYANDLEYGSFVNGEFVSHYRNSGRYYEKLGHSPADVCHKGINGGHYWKNSEKPFFTSE